MKITVVGFDNDAQRLEQLQRGEAPFYEPGLQDLLTLHLGTRLSFASDVAAALEGAEAAFVSACGRRHVLRTAPTWSTVRCVEPAKAGAAVAAR